MIFFKAAKIEFLQVWRSAKGQKTSKDKRQKKKEKRQINFQYQNFKSQKRIGGMLFLIEIGCGDFPKTSCKHPIGMGYG